MQITYLSSRKAKPKYCLSGSFKWQCDATMLNNSSTDRRGCTTISSWRSSINKICVRRPSLICEQKWTQFYMRKEKKLNHKTERWLGGFAFIKIGSIQARMRLNTINSTKLILLHRLNEWKWRERNLIANNYNWTNIWQVVLCKIQNFAPFSIDEQ